MEKIVLATVGLIVIKNNKLLLAYSNNKNAWYLPGGKIDIGENSLKALQREIQEELNITLNPKILKYYFHVTAPAYGESSNIIMEQDCYIYEMKEKIQPSNEIAYVKFFDYKMYKSEPVQLIGVLKVYDKLLKDKILY